MKKEYSVSEAARAARMTGETLRHYDRIGLVSPSYRDEWTSYRYYTDEDIVRLNTVRALQLMDLSLDEIKKALDEIREADFNGTIDECIDADIAFHAALARASHNGILLEFYQMASERLRQWYRTIYSSPEIFASAYDLHDELYRSILQRNPQGAWDAAEAIIKHGRL